MKTETQLTDYREPLKHILCSAIIYIQALSMEVKKLELKEEATDNSPEKIRTATILHNMMVTVNDIIHPAHQFLYEMFPGDEKLYDEMVKYFKGNKEQGIVFKGCQCKDCAVAPKTEDKSTQTDSTTSENLQ